MEANFDVAESPEGRVDLHLHSTASDGRLRPRAVMRAAADAGLAAVALTDHDTLAGIDEAREAALALEIEFVPGIELSTYREEEGTAHLLGYFVRGDDPALARHLERARSRRRDRAREIVGRLNTIGVPVTVEEVFAQTSSEGLISRAHIARALVEGGHVRSHGEAFGRYIGADGPAYVPTLRLNPEAGIRLLHGAGGLAVLAHPGEEWSEERIRAFAEAGLDGLEVLHPDHDRRTVVRLRRLAASLDLLETGGSDWHGPRHGSGRSLATQPVPYGWYARLRDAAEGAVAETVGTEPDSRAG